MTLIVNPATSRRLAIKLRVPDPDVSQLYRSTPLAKGLLSITVNGEAITPKVESGYAVITRQWVAGDRIELELPLEVQRVHAHPSVEAAADRAHFAGHALLLKTSVRGLPWIAAGAGCPPVALGGGEP